MCKDIAVSSKDETRRTTGGEAEKDTSAARDVASGSSGKTSSGPEVASTLRRAEAKSRFQRRNRSHAWSRDGSDDAFHCRACGTRVTGQEIADCMGEFSLPECLSGER